jgi:hypothetical protein
VTVASVRPARVSGADAESAAVATTDRQVFTRLGPRAATRPPRSAKPSPNSAVSDPLLVVTWAIDVTWKEKPR